MAKNYPAEHVNNEGSYYLVGSKDVPQETISKFLDDAYKEFGVTYGSRRYQYGNLTPNLSGRPGLTRSDYYAFRPDERIPKKHKDIIQFTEEVYERNGLIRNIIDLMGEFACQGIRISHTDERTQKFYKEWFDKVNGEERSERFMNNLYRTANIIIRRQTANISLKQRAEMFRASGKPDIKIEKQKISKAEIPWSYTFLNPATVDVIGGDIASFVNKKKYVIKFPTSFQLQTPGLYKEESALFNSLPAEMKEAIKSSSYYLLPDDKTLVFHYKKDDWKAWAKPMIYSILDDIMALEKLKLADIAALDGAVSNLRIIRIGNLEHNIIPGKAAAQKLKEILQSHTGAGTIDIIWGPDIDLIESKSEVYKFLGEDKYKPTMNAIYGAFGIPATLTGTGQGGTTNNFMSLKTLIERLEYGRQILLNFWNEEIRIVQKAMGFSKPAIIEFDYMELSDPAAEKMLLLNLSDRNMISDELLQQKFKHSPTLEEARIARDDTKRGSVKPPKAGPFHDAEHNKALEKMAVQRGYLSPEKVGVKVTDLEDKLKSFDKTKNGIPGQGRPKNSKDKTKRKQKKFVPKSKASLEIWASAAQNAIAEFMNPLVLASYSKKNMRSLSNVEFNTSEKLKFGVLLSLEPYSVLDNKVIENAFSNLKNIDKGIYTRYTNLYNQTSIDIGRTLTVEESHKLQIYLYSEMQNEDNGDI